MIPLGLSTSEQKAFHQALTRDHSIDIRVALLDLEENPKGDLSAWVMGGQVIVDDQVDYGIDRSCQLTLLDPEQRAGIDTDTPGLAAGLARMLDVEYGVWVDELDRWVRVPVFRGPISKVTRDGDILEIEALGKEHLLRALAGYTKVYAAGLTRTGVIRDIAERGGERHMHIPQWTARTGKNSIMVKLGVQSRPWTWMRATARSMGAQLYYDGAGTLRLRKKPTHTSWWFYESQLLSEPKATVDDAEVINTVHVKGSPPEGKTGLIESRGYLPAEHPHSPQKLGRHGARRYLTEFIEDDDIRTQDEADWTRDQRLREIMIDSYVVEFDCLPIPHLCPGDAAHLAWDKYPATFRVRKFTLPLTVSDAMTVGYVRETRRRGGPAARPRPAGMAKK